MENEISIFDTELQVDEEVNLYLGQTAGWAKLVGVLGMAFSIITILKTLYQIVKIASITDGRFFSGINILGRLAVPLLSVAVYFAIGLFSFHFAVKMRAALSGNDQTEFESAWYNLKIAYRLMGIVSTIYFCILLLALLFMSAFL